MRLNGPTRQLLGSILVLLVIGLAIVVVAECGFLQT